MDLTNVSKTPPELNLELIFQKIYILIKDVFEFLSNPKLWHTMGIISMILSLVLLAIIIFSLVRIREIQLNDKADIEKRINEALAREKERQKKENPRWHYILNLSESASGSDWRVAIMEADTMMEEVLKEKGVPGGTVAELLDSARSSGYTYIQDAWDAHLIRNQIAHQGSNFPLSQIETRRVIRLYQNFFEELEVI